MATVGRKIGPYKVLAQIGSGGMATVYQAEQPSLNRMVAIKELRTSLSRDDSMIERFEREALSIAQLAHHNIVHVYDFIKKPPSMYIVMEYVEGIDLYTLLRKVDRLPSEISAIIALQAAQALEYAHFKGVVHRDFKPSNLMLTKEGVVKLMDFGIARDESHEDLTLPGQALGTPAYMSPEQVMGERVDFRSDIFSFGIVLYQMLTGQKPFVEDETLGVMQRIINEPYKRPRAIYPDIPWALQSTVRKCMRKTPNDRFKSTEELRRRLEKWVAKKVRINTAGRLVIYMRHRDLISEKEAETYVKAEELLSIDTLAADSGEVSRWGVVLRPVLMSHLALALVFGLFVFGVNALGSRLQSSFVRVNVVPWADVYVDGELHDTTPFAAPISISPGKHVIEFRNRYYQDTKRNVVLEVGETKDLNIVLKPSS